ncbi:hypothetical protein ACFFK0_19890 [Paenibacillus chartarius]|uniref:Uncharacterized protein n=1 Tax=Paenibacillus chartarius TaxID=747481 RepID=A0ABV6DPU8_9BACL
MHETSLQDIGKVPAELLAERLEPVRELTKTELELYEIVKDRATGEHYLHYAYVHRNVADMSAEESFHHLLPLSSDSVLGLLFNDDPYAYPEYWRSPFLRNGPEGYYVWFDPGQPSEEALAELEGQRIREKMEQFKRNGAFDEASVRKLLEELDPRE